MAFFDQLLNGKTAKRIQREFKLNPRSLRKYLTALEKIGLIEVHPQDRVKRLVVGEPTWRKNGPLGKSFRALAIDEFHKKTRARALQGTIRSYGLLVGFEPFELGLLKKIDNL